jgi:antitoxin MazE
VTTVQKWGNSLGLRIPKPLAREVGLGPGSRVIVKADRGRLVVSAVDVPRYTLAGLLARLTKVNLHGDALADAPTGREQL